MNKVKFLFGIHCHQPVGNFEHIFEEAYQRAYFPFLNKLKDHPKIKFSAHYSGILYDWFNKNHPEIIELIKHMVKNRQLELLSGGYYEPILSIIPENDQLGQIKYCNSFIQNTFNYIPRGLWLTERIWEPHLPKSIKTSGIDYVLVDDYHFMSAGISEEKLFGHYITEEEGEELLVFPISKKLRYLIPFKSPEETIEYLKQIANQYKSPAAILFDDGEKFGVWPGTNKWVYQDGYLDHLLHKIEENLDWIQPVTYSEYIDEQKPIGRIYLPTGSYAEMMEWALPAATGNKLNEIKEEIHKYGKQEKYEKFLRGGFFRNFLVKYPESNQMHKKMFYISKKLQNIKKGRNVFGSKIEDNPDIQNATMHLYMGQCNCAYWHGIFGGLYLNYLRNGVYENLIQADKSIDAYLHGNKRFIDLIVTDFDKDGQEEIIISNNFLNLYFSPYNGGSLFEIDYRPKNFNICNILSRYPETYHEKIKNLQHPHSESSTQSIHSVIKAKEVGLEKLLVYDKGRRASLVDRFIDDSVTLEQIMINKFQEKGNFAKGEYDFLPQRKKEEISLIMRKNGIIIQNNDKLSMTVNKNITMLSGQSIVNVEYLLTNDSTQIIETNFAVEFNLSLLAGDAHDRYYQIPGKDIDNNKLNSIGQIEDVQEVRLIDAWQGFSVSLNTQDKARFWRYPIITVSQSESGFEKNYQGSCIIFSWKIKVDPGQSWSNKLVFKVEE